MPEKTRLAVSGFRAHYHQYRALLAEQLGLDPSPRLRALFAELIQD